MHNVSAEYLCQEHDKWISLFFVYYKCTHLAHSLLSIGLQADGQNIVFTDGEYINQIAACKDVSLLILSYTYSYLPTPGALKFSSILFFFLRERSG